YSGSTLSPQGDRDRRRARHLPPRGPRPCNASMIDRGNCMNRIIFIAIANALSLGIAASPALAQESYPVGNPLGVPVKPTADGAFKPISSNVTVYGAIVSAESCSYDAERGLIVVPNRGVPQPVQTNDA